MVELDEYGSRPWQIAQTVCRQLGYVYGVINQKPEFQRPDPSRFADELSLLINGCNGKAGLGDCNCSCYSEDCYPDPNDDYFPETICHEYEWVQACASVAT